jgi:anti-sigma regulatory factor (Ser/Thr protein kinase)
MTARRTLPAEASSVGSARRCAQAFAERHGLTGARLADLALAVSEAVTNVILHAYRGCSGDRVVDLVLEARDDAIHVAVRDFGLGLVPRDDSPGLGLGLGVIGRMADRVEISAPRGGGTELRMIFAVERPATG